jgi:hypothetical protein
MLESSSSVFRACAAWKHAHVTQNEKDQKYWEFCSKLLLAWWAAGILAPQKKHIRLADILFPSGNCQLLYNRARVLWIGSFG